MSGGSLLSWNSWKCTTCGLFNCGFNDERPRSTTCRNKSHKKKERDAFRRQSFGSEAGSYRNSEVSTPPYIPANQKVLTAKEHRALDDYIKGETEARRKREERGKGLPGSIEDKEGPSGQWSPAPLSAVDSPPPRIALKLRTPCDKGAKQKKQKPSHLPDPPQGETANRTNPKEFATSEGSKRAQESLPQETKEKQARTEFFCQPTQLFNNSPSRAPTSEKPLTPTQRVSQYGDWVPLPESPLWA